MLPRLAAYAAKQLSRAGWFTTKKHETYKMNPKELVDLVQVPRLGVLSPVGDPEPGLDRGEGR